MSKKWEPESATAAAFPKQVHPTSTLCELSLLKTSEINSGKQPKPPKHSKILVKLLNKSSENKPLLACLHRSVCSCSRASAQRPERDRQCPQGAGDAARPPAASPPSRPPRRACGAAPGHRQRHAVLCPQGDNQRPPLLRPFQDTARRSPLLFCQQPPPQQTTKIQAFNRKQPFKQLSQLLQPKISPSSTSLPVLKAVLTPSVKGKSEIRQHELFPKVTAAASMASHDAGPLMARRGRRACSRPLPEAARSGRPSPPPAVRWVRLFLVSKRSHSTGRAEKLTASESGNATGRKVSRGVRDSYLCSFCT